MKLIIYSSIDKFFDTSEKVEEQDFVEIILAFSTYHDPDKR